MKFNDLSIQEKAAVIKLGVGGGLRSLLEIQLFWDGMPDDPPVILKANKSKADFMQRLKDPNREYIRDWENPDNIATHKLSWADDGVVYPQVLNVNGRLVDFSRPPYDTWAGYDNAVRNGDTIHMTPEEAEWFTTHYKDYYPGFNEYKKGGSIHIKPENRGKFTALKKRTGHSATWFKKHGTPALKKMATFALNARKWHHKHPDGGYLDKYDFGPKYNMPDYYGDILVKGPMYKWFALHRNNAPYGEYLYVNRLYDNTMEDKRAFVQKSFDDWYYTFKKNGNSHDDSIRMARFFALQDSFESAYGGKTAYENNNYGGMNDVKEAKKQGVHFVPIHYNKAEDYYNAKYNDITNKWPGVFSPNVKTNEDFFNALHENLDYQYAPADHNLGYLENLNGMKSALRWINEYSKDYTGYRHGGHLFDAGGPDNPPIDENGMYYGQYYPELWDMLSDLRKEQIVQLYNLLNNQNTPYIVQLILNDVAFANSNEGLQLINTAKLDRLNKLAEQQQLQLEILEYASKHGPIAADVRYNGPISSTMNGIGNYMVNHTKNAFTHPLQTFKEDLPELLYYIPGWGQGTLAHDVKEELLNDNPAGALLSAAFLAWPALRKIKNQVTLPFRNAKDLLNGKMARALTERSYVIDDIGSSYNRNADILNTYIARANAYDPSDYYGRKLLDANNLDILVTRKFKLGPRLPLIDEDGNYNYIINKGRKGLMTLPNGEVISNPEYIEYPSGNQELVNLSYGINKGLFFDPNNTIFRYKGEKYAVPDLFSKFIYPEQEVPTSFIEQYMNKELPKQSDIFSKTFNDYVKGIESRMGDNGVLVGSTRLILQGLVGGVPGDIEVLTTKGRLQDVKDKFDFHYLRDTKNGTGIHGTSPYVHTSNTGRESNPMDINIILTDKNGNAIGVETYEIARALFGEDYINGVLMRNADKNAKVSVGNPLSNEQVGIMQPIPRLNGKGFYSDEEIFLLFKNSGKVTEKLLTDTFGSYNVKHSERALALLTSTDNENIKLVETALDHIGKQLGSGYQSLSSRYPNIDFGNYDENIKFLQNIGIKNNIHAIASNPDAMRNIANKYYIEKTAAVRSVNYNSAKEGTLLQVMAPGISLDNGSSAGGGGNTVLNSSFGGFLRGFTGAMQFHPTYHPENVNTLNDIFNLINRQETIFNTPEASKIVQDVFNRHGIRFELNMMNRALFTDQLSVLVQNGLMTLLKAGEITLEISEALDVAGFIGEQYGGLGTYFGSLQTKGMPMTYRNAEYHSSNGGSEMIGGYEFGNTISNASRDSDADLVKKIKERDVNPYYLRYSPQYTDVQSEQLNHMLYFPDDLLYKTPESELLAEEMRKYFDDKAGEYYDRAKSMREKAANLYEFRSKLSEGILPIGYGIGGIGLTVSGAALGVEIMDDNRLEDDAYRSNSTPIELLNERIESTQDKYYKYKEDYDYLSDEEFKKKYGYDKEKFNEFMDFDLSKNMTEFGHDLANWAYKLRKKRQYKEYSKMSNEEWQEKIGKIKKRVEKSNKRLKERQQRAEERYKNKKALGGPIKPFSYLPIPEVRY